jgi:molecular chaperone DnaJ
MTAETAGLDVDLYAVLGVPETATDKEVQRAYRRLARMHHPDRNADDAEAEERFKEISAAYDVLGHPERRGEYDELRRHGARARARRSGASGPAWRRSFDVGVGDVDGGPPSRRARRPRARGTDLEAELTLGFGDAVFGLTTEVTVTSAATCDSCGGAGVASGRSRVTCPTCHGRGQVARSQGFVTIHRTCPHCGGAGQVVETPCPSCRGSGVRRRPRAVRVRLPAGVDDGQRIRLPGRGEPGQEGGPPGDLFVTVRVEPHEVFGRDGADLTVRVPVRYPDAVLGAEVEVPTLDGPPVTVRIPPGTPSGRVLRVRGRGVPRRSGGRGDLLVTVEVAVPLRVGVEERRAVEELAAVMDREIRARGGAHHVDV